MSEDIRFLHSGPLTSIKRWGTKWSLWPVHLVTACCGVELAHAYACGYDAERIGSLNYGICRQTNVIIVEGAITRKMAKVLRVSWEQMPNPKFVIVMGACGLKGGLFWNSYHMVRPSEVVPVDYFVPGCPPTPEALIRAIVQLQDKIMSGEAKNSAEFKEVDLGQLLGVAKEVKPKKPPKSPKKVDPKPEIVIDKPKDVEWEFGQKLVEELQKDLVGIAESVTITDINRICVKVKKENVLPAVSKLSSRFDHVKSVNVIDVPHENKFIVEFWLGCYSNRELMPVLVNVATEIPRDDPKVPSIAGIFPSADYMEREMHDLFGVWFDGNPWMGKNFLLSPDTPKYPLRKDFKLEEDKYVVEG